MPNFTLVLLSVYYIRIYPTCTLSTMDCGLISRETFLILLAPRTLALLRYASRKSVWLIR